LGNEKAKIPLKNLGDFPFPDSPTSNRHIPLIRAQKLANLVALERGFQGLSFDILKPT